MKQGASRDCQSLCRATMSGSNSSPAQALPAEDPGVESTAAFWPPLDKKQRGLGTVHQHRSRSLPAHKPHNDIRSKQRLSRVVLRNSSVTDVRLFGMNARRFNGKSWRARCLGTTQGVQKADDNIHDQTFVPIHGARQARKAGILASASYPSCMG